jgi:hypothetical protein
MKLLILTLSLAIALAPPVLAAAAKPAGSNPAEYKRADANFYWKGDVLKVDPNAVIIPEGGYTRQGDFYLLGGKKKNPAVVYVQVVNDWIEPITPPGAVSMGVPSDAIQIREPHGDVQVAFPSAPATFLPVQDGMTLANGSVIKTGAWGTVAVVFGGVASARLIPHSAAAVQQTLTPGLRSTEIDLTRGAVFSKVGKPLGEKEDYTVHTPFGVAAARGTDFVSIAMPARTDVWIAEGTVDMTQPGGTMVGQISADGSGPLKIIRFPLMPDAHNAMMASAETMTTAMNFIPLVNQKVIQLRARLARGEKLSDAETKYLSLIKKVPCLIKLVLVPPPPPPPPPAKPPAAPKTPPQLSPGAITVRAKPAAPSSNATNSTTGKNGKTQAKAAPAAPAPVFPVATNAPPVLQVPADSQTPTMTIP